jgi:hypothetical protein
MYIIFLLLFTSTASPFLFSRWLFLSRFSVFCHSSFLPSRLLPLPCPLPLSLFPLHRPNPTSYRPPPHQVSGNRWIVKIFELPSLIILTRTLDHVFSTTSRRAASFEQQIKAIEVCTVPLPSCHRLLPLTYLLSPFSFNRRSSPRT